MRQVRRLARKLLLAGGALSLACSSSGGGNDEGFQVVGGDGAAAGAGAGGGGSNVPQISGAGQPGSGAAGSQGSEGTEGGGVPDLTPNEFGGFGDNPVGTPGGAGGGDFEGCEGLTEQATARFKPQDIVLVVDNSGSMDDEAQAVQDRINEDLAEILSRSKVDYRVILLSRYGGVGEEVDDVETGICIGAPLGGHDCSDPDSDGDGDAGQPLTHTERFFHYSESIDSTDAWCQILDKFTSSEDATDHPGVSGLGWRAYARPEAFKNFVVITDDRVDCEEDDGPWEFEDQDTVAGGQAAAAEFDLALTALSPLQFGTPTARNYNFHSIVGLSENEPITAAWLPDDPLTEEECSDNGEAEVENAGTGYQALSALTGGLRYPICQNASFDAIFQRIAEGIVEGATLSCEWDIPAAPEGQEFDRDLVNVQYTASEGATVSFARVDSAADCVDGAWHYDDLTAPSRVLACPSTCSTLESDAGASVEIQFGCATRVIIQ